VQHRLLDPGAAIGFELGRSQRADFALQSGKIVGDDASATRDRDSFPSATLKTPPPKAQ